MTIPNFTFLSYLILYVLLIYFAILGVFLVIRRKEIKARLQLHPPVFHQAYDDSSFTFDWTTKVEDIGESIFGRNYRIPLALVRIIGFLYFFIFGIIWSGKENGRTFNFFDGWNTILIFMYFLCSSITSVIFIRSASFATVQENVDGSVSAVPLNWSFTARLFAVTAHMLFEIGGANSLLILFGVVLGIGSVGTLDITNLLAVVLLSVEMLLNNMKVRFDQYPATAAYLMLYLFVVWPSVFTGAMQFWPYPFLDTGNGICFLWYSLLFLASFFCYVLWYGAYKAKRKIVLYLLFGRNGLHRDDLEIIELLELSSQQDRQEQQQSQEQRGREGSGGQNRGQLDEDQQSATSSFYTLPDQNNEEEGSSSQFPSPSYPPPHNSNNNQNTGGNNNRMMTRNDSGYFSHSSSSYSLHNRPLLPPGALHPNPLAGHHNHPHRNNNNNNSRRRALPPLPRNPTTRFGNRDDDIAAIADLEDEEENNGDEEV
jgi:hypothetical protein